MAVMTQDNMMKLVRGGNIVDDSSMDVQLRHMTSIAIAALGDDSQALRAVLKEYTDEMEELVNGANFFTPQHRSDTQVHIQWLRSL